MPLILSQKLQGLQYNDVVGETYHYPRRYWSSVVTGEIFIYYHPAEQGDRSQYYFGLGRIGSVFPDRHNADHRYAEIIDYLPFDTPVPFKDGDKYIEAVPHQGTAFFRSVRPVSRNVFDHILALTSLDTESVGEFSEFSSETDYDQILETLNKRFRTLEPNVHERLVHQIDRPTSISNALKKRQNYVCQICGCEGFEKRTGGRYAEAHHLIALHELVPGSLVTDNILVVCANCHRKLHYADVEITDVSDTALDISINGTKYHVERNVLS